MTRLLNFLPFAFLLTVFALPSVAQDNSNIASTLDKAKEFSAATGRPIFAVAGKST